MFVVLLTGRIHDAIYDDDNRLNISQNNVCQQYFTQAMKEAAGVGFQKCVLTHNQAPFILITYDIPQLDSNIL